MLCWYKCSATSSRRLKHVSLLWISTTRSKKAFVPGTNSSIGTTTSFGSYVQIARPSSSIIILCIIIHARTIRLILSLSQSRVAYFTTCHVCLRTPNALSISFLADSCFFVNNFAFSLRGTEYAFINVE